MCPADVRFRGQSGHGDERPECLLLTQSGHERLGIAAAQNDGLAYSAARKSLL